MFSLFWFRVLNCLVNLMNLYVILFHKRNNTDTRYPFPLYTLAMLSEHSLILTTDSSKEMLNLAKSKVRNCILSRVEFLASYLMGPLKEVFT